MKSLKRVVAILMCLFFGAVASVNAQGLRVSVLNDAKEPLPHAYVYVNGRAVAVADTLGRAVIPQEKLKVGDTISISYVATEDRSVAVYQDMLTEGEYQFIMQEIYGTLHADEVVVKADFDIKKHYRKHVKQLERFYFSSLWTSDFSMNISKSGDSIRTAGGKFKITKLSPYHSLNHIVMNPQFTSSYYSPLTAHDSIGRPAFWTHLPLEITTYDDTTGLSRAFQNFLPSALQITDYSITYTRIQEKTYMVNHYGSKLNYGYLGKDAYHRIFRLSYSAGELGHNWQILIKCDTQSGDISEITTNILNLGSGTIIYVKAKIRTKVKGVNTLYVPIELEYRNEYNDGTMVDVTMKNIDLEYYRWKEKDIQRVLRRGKLD